MKLIPVATTIGVSSMAVACGYHVSRWRRVLPGVLSLETLHVCR